MAKENNAERFQREQVELLKLEFNETTSDEMDELEAFQEFTYNKLAQIIIQQANINMKLETMNGKVNRLR